MEELDIAQVGGKARRLHGGIIGNTLYSPLVIRGGQGDADHLQEYRRLRGSAISITQLFRELGRIAGFKQVHEEYSVRIAMYRGN